MKQRLFYVAVTLLCALTVSPIAVTGTHLPASAADEASPGARDGASPGDVVAGERLFETWCAGCHRPSGSGPDLLAPGGVGAGVPFETLLPLVRDGDGHAAPPGRYRPSELNDGQIRELAAYISASAGTSLPSENAEAAPAPVATATPVASPQPTGVPLATPGGACQGSGCPCRQTEPPRFVRAWGRDSSAPDQLRSPSGAAQAPDGTVYVVDATDDRVAYFDADGTFRGQWGTAGSGDGQFTSPTSVAVTADGQTVYVTDSGNHRVQVFAADGTYQTQWGGQGNGDGQFDGPTGLAVAPDGTVYVADANNHRVQRFDATGTFLGGWGGHGDGDGQFETPLDVAVAPDGGTIYVVDFAHGVQAFDAAGAYVGQWGGAGSGDARVFLPLGVTAAPDGTIYVTLDETVKHFDAAGTYLGSWGSESGSVGAGDGEFWHPYDVAVAPDGVTVYVADTNNHRVQIFEAAPCADGGGRAEQPTRSIRWGAGESVVAFADTP